MSGGSYDYAFRHVEEMASEIRSRSDVTLQRLAFADVLDRVAHAMKAIEWVDGGDWAKDRELEALAACVHPEDVNRAALRQAESALATIREALGK